MTEFRRYPIPKPDPANQKEKDLYFSLNRMILDLDTIFNKSADWADYDTRYLMLDAAHPMTSTDLIVNLNADLLDGNHASAFAVSAHNHDSDYLGITDQAADSLLWAGKSLPALETGKYLTNDGTDLSWGAIDLSVYVPYTGANANLNLGVYSLTAQSVIVEKTTGASNLFVRNDETHYLQFQSYKTFLGGYSQAFFATEGLDLYCNNVFVDYFQFTVVSNVPTIGTVGDCNLKITASSGLIDFDNENLLITGNIYNRLDNSKHYFGTGDDASIYYNGTNLVIDPKEVGSGYVDLNGGNILTTGTGTFGTLLLGSGSITDSSGAISFNNENLTTTGTLGAGATTVTSLDAGSGAITTTGTATIGDLLINLPASTISTSEVAILGGAFTIPLISATTNVGSFNFLGLKDRLYVFDITGSGHSYITLSNADASAFCIIDYNTATDLTTFSGASGGWRFGELVTMDSTLTVQSTIALDADSVALTVGEDSDLQLSYISGTGALIDDATTQAISFADNNLTTTGTLGAGAITGTSLTDGTLTIDDGSITGGVNATFSGTGIFSTQVTTPLLEAAAVGTTLDLQPDYSTVTGVGVELFKNFAAGHTSAIGPKLKIHGATYSDIARYGELYIGTYGELYFGGNYTNVNFSANIKIPDNKYFILGTTNDFAFRFVSATDKLALTYKYTTLLADVTATGDWDYKTGDLTTTGIVGTPQIKTDTVTPTDLTITTGAAKTLVLTTSVYDDLQFQVSAGKVTPASGEPTWETFTTNTKEYAFDIDDYIDTQVNELPHWWKEGTTGHAHLHITTKAVPAQEEKAQFTVTFAYADVNEVWVEAPLTAELTIPISTTALTNFYLDLGDLTLTNYLVGAQIRCRIKRVAKTAGGTEYTGDIFITQAGIHLEKTRMGSRAELTL